MTIAMCYVSPEGIVLGADSTASANVATQPGTTSLHYLNHTQKVFEIGEHATLGVITAGLGSLSAISYRTLFAQLSDRLLKNPPSSVGKAVDEWIDLFWAAYSADAYVSLFNALASLTPYDVNNPNKSGCRTLEQESAYSTLKSTLIVSFCFGGRVELDRTPQAYAVDFLPDQPKPLASQIPMLGYWYHGAQNIVKRMINGCDDTLRSKIFSSPFWTGSESDLDQILAEQVFGHPLLPIRDAIDFVYTCIYSTIKAFKFSIFNQICGGPIEIAVITTDRKFRWVRHKEWDAAITEGDARWQSKLR